MKQIVSITLCLIVLMPLENGWAQDIDNIEPMEPSYSKKNSIINSASEFAVDLKNKFISPSDLLMDIKRQNLDVIRTVEEYVSDIFDLKEKEKNAPYSSWFGDTKDTVRRDLNEILEELHNLLLGNEYDYFEQISDQDDRIKELKEEIAELQEEDMTALEEGSLFRDGKEDIQQKINSKLDDIISHESNISEIYKDIQERYKLLGIELSISTIETLMERIDGNDVLQNVELVNTVKKLIPVLQELMATGNENTKKYYGVSVILREVIVYSQMQYMQKNRTVYLPEFNDIFDSTNEILNLSKIQLKNLYDEDESDSYRINIYKNNIEQNMLTIKVINLQRRTLIEHYDKVEAVYKISLKDLDLAYNTYETAKASMEVLDLVQNTDKEFNSIMSMQAPDLVPFENEEMKKQFYDMTKKVRSSL